MVESRQQRRYRERQGLAAPAVPTPVVDGEKPGKGKFDGNCNRTACQVSIQGRNYWNSSTRAYYCRGCAGDINYWSNRDEGIIICTAVTSADDQPAFPYERMRSRAVAG